MMHLVFFGLMNDILTLHFLLIRAFRTAVLSYLFLVTFFS